MRPGATTSHMPTMHVRKHSQTTAYAVLLQNNWHGSNTHAAGSPSSCFWHQHPVFNVHQARLQSLPAPPSQTPPHKQSNMSQIAAHTAAHPARAVALAPHQPTHPLRVHQPHALSCAAQGATP